MRFHGSLLLAAGVVLLWGACDATLGGGGSVGDASADAEPDSAGDSFVPGDDAGVDGGADASPDVGPDVGPDAGPHKGPPFPRLLSFRTLLPGQTPSALARHCRLNGAVFSLNSAAFGEAATLKSEDFCPESLILVTRGWGYNDFRPAEPDFLPDHRHWLFALGSDAASGSVITSETTRVYVKANDNFADGDYAALVSLGDDQRPDWQAYEEVRVVALGTDANGPFIDLERAQYGTVAQTFDATRTRIMIHEWSVVDWTGHPRWELNLSRMAPNAPDGFGPAYHLARFFARLFAQHSHLLDGLQFDVAKWIAFWSQEGPDRRGVLLDCDLDGVGDDCYEGGVNTFAVGVMDFLRLLREGGEDFEGVGNDVILVADGQGRVAQGAVPFLNGIEIENFPGFAAEQQYKLLPAALDTLSHWQQTAGVEARVSYGLTKKPVETFAQPGCPLDLSGTNFRYRIGLVSALMTGSYYSLTPNLHEPHKRCGPALEDGPVFVDEFFAGVADTSGYLGYPIESARWLLEGLATPAVYQAGFETGTEGWTVKTSGNAVVQGPVRDDASATTGQGSLRTTVADVGPGRPKPWRAKLVSPVFNVEAGRTYTLRFSARAENLYGTYSGDPRYGEALRYVEALLVSTDDDTHLGTVRLYFGPHWREQLVTFRVDDSGPATRQAKLALHIGMDGGPVWIDGLALFAGCGLVMSRRFEGGLALLNGCLDASVTIDMDRQYPAESYRRIDGTVDPAVNDGSPVGPTLILPARDALILLREAR